MITTASRRRTGALLSVTSAPSEAIDYKTQRFEEMVKDCRR